MFNLLSAVMSTDSETSTFLLYSTVFKWATTRGSDPTTEVSGWLGEILIISIVSLRETGHSLLRPLEFLK